jgi:Trk K+ transport system NAD-binding subunit
MASLVPDGDEAVVLALKRDGTMLFRPAAQTAFFAGDEIVVAGPPEGIRAIDQRLRA